MNKDILNAYSRILSHRSGPDARGGMVHAIDALEEYLRAVAAGLRIVHGALASAIQADNKAEGVTFTWAVPERFA